MTDSSETFATDGGITDSSLMDTGENTCARY